MLKHFFQALTMFDDSVVIIEEAHNLIGAVVNESELKTRVYDYIYKAKNCKVVALSGTPAINSPHEIAYLMNLLRGPIERVFGSHQISYGLGRSLDDCIFPWTEGCGYSRIQFREADTE